MAGRVCVLVVCAAVAAAEVLELDDSNFQETVGAAELAAVVFHAPWSDLAICLCVCVRASSPPVQVPPL
jgi:hypothetical protein